MEEPDPMRRTSLGLRVEVDLEVGVPRRGVVLVLKEDGRGVLGMVREVEGMRVGEDRREYSLTLLWL